jgi:hypothetical protein
MERKKVSGKLSDQSLVDGLLLGHQLGGGQIPGVQAPVVVAHLLLMSAPASAVRWMVRGAGRDRMRVRIAVARGEGHRRGDGPNSEEIQARGQFTGRGDGR